MTNSTDKNEKEAQNQPTKEKKQKKKGIFRFEAIIPFLCVSGALAGYYTLFFDSHARKGLEWTATQIHGAEVNIEEIKTSFKNAFGEVHGIQVTDKSDPNRNIIQVDKVRFEISWDALLRAKVVIDDASINNIQVYAPRKKPGRIIPPEETKNPEAERIKKEVLQQTAKQFDGNAVGDLAAMAGGAAPKDQLEDIRGDLSAEKYIEDLEKQLDQKEKEWKNKVEELKSSDKIKALTEEAKKLKFKSFDDVKKFSSLSKKAKAVLNEYKAASTQLKNDVSTFTSGIKNIDELIEQDINGLQKRMNLPNLDTASLSESMLGSLFPEKAADIRKYMALAREYMPPKKSEEEKKPTIVPKKRGDGKNYIFPITTSYPTFWLKKAEVTSQSSSSEYSGDINGKLTDLTSHPSVINKPALLVFAGDFPKQQLYGLNGEIKIDHTTENPYESLKFSMNSFPITRQELSKSDNVKFAIDKAQGDMQLNAITRGDSVNINILNNMKNASYDIQAKSKQVDEILKNVVTNIPVVNINATASGKWEELKWSIKSNLGDEIARGFKREVQRKIDDAKAKLRDKVNNRLGDKKEKLMSKYNKLKNQISDLLSKEENKIDGEKKNLEAKKGKVEDQTKKKVKDKAKKLFKKLKF